VPRLSVGGDQVPTNNIHQENMCRDVCACGDYMRLYVRAQAYMCLSTWLFRVHAIVRTVPVLTCGSMLDSKGIHANAHSNFPEALTALNKQHRPCMSLYCCMTTTTYTGTNAGVAKAILSSETQVDVVGLDSELDSIRCPFCSRIFSLYRRCHKIHLCVRKL